jgi:hypothetical protein
MRVSIRLGVATSLLLTGWLAVLPANAGLLNIVSRFGVDSGTCGPANDPCATLQQAINNLDPNGTVVVEDRLFDPGAATIDRAVTIVGGTVNSPGGPCLTVAAAPLDPIRINNFHCNQGGSEEDGIDFQRGHKLDLINSNLLNGGGNNSCGVRFRPNSDAELNILNGTHVSGFGSGVCSTPRNGAQISGVIQDSTIQNSTSRGIRALAVCGKNLAMA